MKTSVCLKQIMKKILLTLAFLSAALAAHAQSWTNRYGGSESVFAGGVAIAVDTNDNVIVTGVAADTNALTIKYSNSGLPLWTNTYSGLAGKPRFQGPWSWTATATCSSLETWASQAPPP